LPVTAKNTRLRRAGALTSRRERPKVVVNTVHHLALGQPFSPAKRAAGLEIFLAAVYVAPRLLSHALDVLYIQCLENPNVADAFLRDYTFACQLANPVGAEVEHRRYLTRE